MATNSAPGIFRKQYVAVRSGIPISDAFIIPAIWGLTNIAAAVSIAFDTFFGVLSASDKIAFWSKVKTNAIDVLYPTWTLGPTYPLSWYYINQGVSINSGVIITALTFYEQEPARLLPVLQWGAGEALVILSCLDSKD